MKKWPWVFLMVFIIGLDQASKYFALVSLPPYQPLAVMPMLNFTLAFNTGAAFSFLSTGGALHRWFFALFSTIVSIVLLVWLYRTPKSARLQLAAISFILGGAVGNLLDRAILGYVIDFIQVYYKEFYWPVFNLADSAICIGAVLLMVDLYKNRAR